MSRDKKKLGLPDAPRRRFSWGVAGALFLLVVGVYIPSMFNGFIWDDPQYVVENPQLKSPVGLWNIWTDPWATPQYYPMVHSTFWVEAQLWGTTSATGFHIDNILLHAMAVLLLWRALVALEIPCPWLAAAIFAVHPVMVESVTWVTERKNVLSIVFYLLAFRAYRKSGGLGPTEPSAHSRTYWYYASLGLFLLALLSKTVTCSLPATILLVIWWKRGHIRFTDIKPLLPMFIVGLLLSAFTGHLEQSNVGARGPDFNWSILDRCLIAGHAVCFYAGKIVWPHPLIFMYPRWDLHSARALQMIYPTAAIAALILLLVTRHRIGRGPLTAVLFFIGTLTPALGFVNVYPMRYSFVADHFQYLASLGIIVLVGSILGQLKGRWQLLFIPVLCPLIWLTITQQLIYKDAKTLWQNTIAQNETCWMAHVNLAGEYGHEKNLPAAMRESQRALELAPNEADTQYDMGVAMALRGDWSAATDRFRNAIACDEGCSQAWSYLSLVLWQHYRSPQDQVDAVDDAGKALQLNPHLSAPHFVLGSFAELRGDLPGAIAEYKLALMIDPNNIPAHADLGRCLLQTGHPDWAAGEFLKVIEHDPKNLPALTNLGNAALSLGRANEAIAYYQRALAIDPKWQPAIQGIGRAKSQP